MKDRSEHPSIKRELYSSGKRGHLLLHMINFINLAYWIHIRANPLALHDKI